MENINLPKVIGHVTLPNAPIKHKCVCDDCGNVVNDRFGDQRIEVRSFGSKDSNVPSSIRMICTDCADLLFEDSSPCSIFGW